MSPAERLPLELWLIIFEFAAIEAHVSLGGVCDSTNFPEVIAHLRSPRKYPPINNICPRNLRLVCRKFNALINSSPYLFMKEESSIPDGTRAVYIGHDPEKLLGRILSERAKAKRIIVLDFSLAGAGYYTKPGYFDLLCENAASLPEVRSLSLTLCDPTPHLAPRLTPNTPTGFWGRLNDAFPFLTCLVLRGKLGDVRDYRMTRFTNLKILDMDQVTTNSTFHFPAVRHVAFTNMSSAATFMNWGWLESLIFRGWGCGSTFSWRLSPKLRMLGVPGRWVRRLPSLPSTHPLERLHIYVGPIIRDNLLLDGQRQMDWLKMMAERLPTITMVTLEYEEIDRTELSQVASCFGKNELEALGLEMNTVASCFDGKTSPYRVIFNRISVDPQPAPEGEVPSVPPIPSVPLGRTYTPLEMLRRL